MSYGAKTGKGGKRTLPGTDPRPYAARPQIAVEVFARMDEIEAMRCAPIAIIALLSSAAAFAGPDDKLPPEAYVRLIDQQIARSGAGVPGRPFPCSYEEVIDGSAEVASSPTELCVKMLPQQRWRGLWRNQFEGSRFCQEPAKTCDATTPGEKIWLSQTPGHPGGGLYWIELVGRRTMYRGPYGHLGMSDHELIIDRVISMKELEAPLPPPTKADAIRYWKQCEAAKTCIPNWDEINKLENGSANP
jgi:hypothetical protein